MRTIIIGFSRPANTLTPFSWLIRKFENTEFSHVFVRIKADKFNRELIYQASGLSVNFYGGVLFDKKHETLHRFELEVPEEIYNKVIAFAIDKVGLAYGIRQIFGILYLKALNLLGIRASNPFNNGSEEYICSELVAEILSNFTHLSFSELDSVTPKMIYEAISTYPEARRI